MKRDFEKKYVKELTYDLPLNFYKLKIKPVKMANYFDFLDYSSIITIKKNRIPDPAILSMNYLEFLFFMQNEADIKTMAMFRWNFYQLLKLCIEDVESGNNVYFYTNENNKLMLSINEVKLDYKQFDEFREIVMWQNFPNYENDENLDPTLAEELEKAEELKSNGAKSVSLEKRIALLMADCSLSIDEIMDLSLRKFAIMMEMHDKELHYKIAKQASLSGFVEFKSGIDHYLTEREENITDKMIDVGAFTGQFGGAAVNK